jgi:hypothetical protein
MFRSRIVILATFALALVLVACTTEQDDSGTTSDRNSHGNEIGGYVELVDALGAAGTSVEPAGTVEQPFFSVDGQIIRVNGADVQVFEYADEVARQTESERISNDGSAIGTSMVTWVERPNFWATGRVIVLYVGTNGEIMDLLEGALGEPTTQGSG